MTGLHSLATELRERKLEAARRGAEEGISCLREVEREVVAALKAALYVAHFGSLGAFDLSTEDVAVQSYPELLGTRKKAIDLSRSLVEVASREVAQRMSVLKSLEAKAQADVHAAEVKGSAEVRAAEAVLQTAAAEVEKREGQACVEGKARLRALAVERDKLLNATFDTVSLGWPAFLALCVFMRITANDALLMFGLGVTAWGANAVLNAVLSRRWKWDWEKTVKIKLRPIEESIAEEEFKLEQEERKLEAAKCAAREEAEAAKRAARANAIARSMKLADVLQRTTDEIAILRQTQQRVEELPRLIPALRPPW